MISRFACAFLAAASLAALSATSPSAAQESAALIIVPEKPFAEPAEPPPPLPKVQIQVRLVEFEGSLPAEIQSRIMEASRRDIHERVKLLLDSPEPPAEPAWQRRPYGVLAILTQPEATRAIEKLSAAHSTDMLTFPLVTTASGRSARLAFNDEEPVLDPPFHAPLHPSKTRNSNLRADEDLGLWFYIPD